MLKLNKKVDYGIIILTHLVHRGDEVVSAADLARIYGLSRPLAANVLKQLTRAGIVNSSRGSKGGYRLEKPPAEITLHEVVRVIDGEFNLTECTTHGGDGTTPTTCDVAPTCPIRKPIQFVHDQVASILDRLTFDMIAAGSNPLLSAGGVGDEADVDSVAVDAKAR